MRHSVANKSYAVLLKEEKMKNRVLLIFLVLAILGISACGSKPAEEDEEIISLPPVDSSAVDLPSVNVASFLIIDLESGESLLSLRENMQIQPASLTKLMTTYILLERVVSGEIYLDETVIISANAASSVGSSAGIRAGAEMSIDSLIYCMLLPSGCDAAVAVAEFLFGSEEAMVEQMNKTAAALGMENTFFADSTGILFEQLITARDISLLVMRMLEIYPALLDYTSEAEKTVYYDFHGREQELLMSNTNLLLTDFDDVRGLKTGTIGEIRNIIIITENDTKQRMIVILGAPDPASLWQSAHLLMEYEFEQ